MEPKKQNSLRDICFSAIQVPKFIAIGEDYRLDISKVVAYQDYNWLTVEGIQDESGEVVSLAYSDSYALSEVGGGVTIWFEDSAGNIKSRNIFYTLSEDDKELKEFTEKMVEFLDVVFVNQNEVSLIIPALNEEVRRIRGEEYIKIGNLRVNIKAIQAYWREDIDVVEPADLHRITAMMMPDDVMFDGESFMKGVDLLNLTRDSSTIPIMFVELYKPREIFPDRSPTIVPVIYSVEEDQNPAEERDRLFARLDSVLLKSRITMPEHFEDQVDIKTKEDENGEEK